MRVNFNNQFIFEPVALQMRSEQRGKQATVEARAYVLREAFPAINRQLAHYQGTQVMQIVLTCESHMLNIPKAEFSYLVGEVDYTATPSLDWREEYVCISMTLHAQSQAISYQPIEEKAV
jgi:hypothetical protein